MLQLHLWVATKDRFFSSLGPWPAGLPFLVVVHEFAAQNQIGLSGQVSCATTEGCSHKTWICEQLFNQSTLWQSNSCWKIPPSIYIHMYTYYNIYIWYVVFPFRWPFRLGFPSKSLPSIVLLTFTSRWFTVLRGRWCPGQPRANLGGWDSHQHHQQRGS